jgi:hypothetical protein
MYVIRILILEEKVFLLEFSYRDCGKQSEGPVSGIVLVGLPAFTVTQTKKDY